MEKPNKEELKAAARDKRIQAKQAAANKKKLKENPPPTYVNLDEVEFSGDYEADAKIELDEVAKGFRDRLKDENTRFALATDSEYWACLCFQTREQKEVFLKALALIDLGDKYLDGQEVAKVLGVTLPEGNVPYNTGDKSDKSWLEFVE